MTDFAGKHRTGAAPSSSVAATTAADPSLRHADGQTPTISGSVSFRGEDPEGTDPTAPAGGWLKLAYIKEYMGW